MVVKILALLGISAFRQTVMPLEPVLYCEEHQCTEIVEKQEISQSQFVTDIILNTFADDGYDAVKVAECESRLNPEAKNKNSSATGLFQVLAKTHGIDERWLVDPEINALVAYKLFLKSGWQPWKASAPCHGLY